MLNPDSDRINRGSCWNKHPHYAQVVRREGDYPGARYVYLGVRLVEVFERSKRVNRGGGWGSVPQGARVAFRSGYDPGRRNDRLGIRLVEEVDENQTPASGSPRFVQGGHSGLVPQIAQFSILSIVNPGTRSNRLGVRLVEVIDV